MDSLSSKSGLNITKGMTQLPEGLTPRMMIAEYLRSIRPYFQTLIEKHIKSTGLERLLLSPTEIMYCFTVPIEWNESQVNIMREASFDAGYIEDLDSTNLLFCHEPVAAAFAITRRVNNFLPNSRALIVDAGGGTVDFFTCKFTANGDRVDHEMTEVTKSLGDFFGASLIDQLFWEFIEKKLGPVCFSALTTRAELRTCYREMSHKWDSMKREFSDSETAWRSGRAGPSYKVIELTAFAMNVFSSMDPAPELDGFGEIRITREDMKSFFDPVVTSIIFLIARQLDEAHATPENPVDFLFLVGGFSVYRLSFLISPRHLDTLEVRWRATLRLNQESIRFHISSLPSLWF